MDSSTGKSYFQIQIQHKKLGLDSENRSSIRRKWLYVKFHKTEPELAPTP